uniref:Uncharacterized protein n=1 Tax=Cacopsylla melanoneura TaxID=428564 RepID=A0A8D8S9Q1_9HEMI
MKNLMLWQKREPKYGPPPPPPGMNPKYGPPGIDPKYGPPPPPPGMDPKYGPPGMDPKYGPPPPPPGGGFFFFLKIFPPPPLQLTHTQSYFSLIGVSENLQLSLLLIFLIQQIFNTFYLIV